MELVDHDGLFLALPKFTPTRPPVILLAHIGLWCMPIPDVGLLVDVSMA